MSYGVSLNGSGEVEERRMLKMSSTGSVGSEFAAKSTSGAFPVNRHSQGLLNTAASIWRDAVRLLPKSG